jgi:hypothetical protein
MLFYLMHGDSYDTGLVRSRGLAHPSMVRSCRDLTLLVLRTT